ncbi:MAG: hypothetical protein Kow0031_14420 [Anaerolineae bacterium]
MEKSPTITIQTDLPPGLFAAAEQLVEAGWFGSVNEVMLDALRRFLESHQTKLLEDFVRQDVEWGLHGHE